MPEIQCRQYLSYNVPEDGNDRSAYLVVRTAFDTTIPTDVMHSNEFIDVSDLSKILYV
jgi:hypothetical protein